MYYETYFHLDFVAGEVEWEMHLVSKAVSPLFLNFFFEMQGIKNLLLFNLILQFFLTNHLFLSKSDCIINQRYLNSSIVHSNQS